MFVVAPEEFVRMNEVNERLRELTHELHHQVADAHEMAKRAFLGKDFTVEATLKFVSKSDGAMIVRPNDDYYGSNFAKVLLVIHRLYEQGYVRPDYIDSVSSKDLNDGTLSQRLAEMSAYEDWQPAAEAFKGLDTCEMRFMPKYKKCKNFTIKCHQTARLGHYTASTVRVRNDSRALRI